MLDSSCESYLARFSRDVSEQMTTTLRAKAPLVVPPSVQRKARLKAGDQVEFKATPGRITVVSKPPGGPSRSPFRNGR